MGDRWPGYRQDDRSDSNLDHSRAIIFPSFVPWTMHPKTLAAPEHNNGLSDMWPSQRPAPPGSTG